MIVERFPRNPAADAGLAVLTPEGHAVAAGLVLRLREDKRASVGHAEHIEDRQHGRKLQVFLGLLQSRNGRRAHLGERGQPLLGQLQAVSPPDGFFDKNWPIDLKLPFHRRSISSRSLFPRASSPTCLAASVTAFSAALRRR